MEKLKKALLALLIEIVIGIILHITLTPLGFPQWAIVLIEISCSALIHYHRPL